MTHEVDPRYTALEQLVREYFIPMLRRHGSMELRAHAGVLEKQDPMVDFVTLASTRELLEEAVLAATRYVPTGLEAYSADLAAKTVANELTGVLRNVVPTTADPALADDIVRAIHHLALCVATAEYDKAHQAALASAYKAARAALGLTDSSPNPA